MSRAIFALVTGSSPSGPPEPGTQGTPAAFIALIAWTLSPIRRITSAVGPMKMKPGFFHALGEIGVLGKESVARMDRLRVGDFGGRDDRRHVEIALGRRRRADADRFVGHADVLEIAIDRRVHGDGADAERMARAQHAQRDFAAVCDDDFI